MRLIASIIAFLSAAGVAWAAEPGYFRVIGVKADDVLNIRADPKPEADAVGELAPGAGPVEILEVETSGGSEWGRLVAGDGDGWVSMRFLEAIEVETVGETLIPDGLVCGGAEPFWDITLSKSAGLKFNSMVGLELTMPFTLAMNATARQHRFAVRASSQGYTATAMLGKNEICYDSMADGTYGWRVDLLLEKPGDADYPQLFEGCCRMPLPN